MTVYHQIGHNCTNLVGLSELSEYMGVVCSPVNYNLSEMLIHNQNFGEIEKIFDPQLYFPRTERGVLRDWDYFPSDFETRDLSNQNWWNSLCDVIIENAIDSGCNAICSPVNIPNVYTDAYYSEFVNVGNYLVERLRHRSIELNVYQTVVIDFDTLINKRPEEIASILSRTDAQGVYLVINTNIEPRRELTDSLKIVQVMKVIRYLSDSGISVFVPFCSSDLILWKYSGAQSFSSGKFFNLRRFSSSRFDEPSKGGGQLPYWFDRGLLAFLREGDVIRLENAGKLDNSYLNNPFSLQILNKIKTPEEKAWLGDSWRFYMSAFYDLDNYCSTKLVIKNLLKDAEKKWADLDDTGILMEEVKNDGSWIRSWRVALADFDRFFND